jgi:hypothetical protein
MGGASGRHGEKRNTNMGLVENLKERDYLEDLTLDGMVILKFKKIKINL